MGQLFHLILSRPLLNLLIWFYDVIPLRDLGLAIIALTLLIRFLLWPSFQKSLRSQKDLQKLQPKLNEIKEKYKDNQEAQAKATMELYKAHKVSPFSSCLPLIIQLPILIALYRVFLTGIHGNFGSELYSFVTNPGNINTSFLGLVELTKPNYIFAVLAGIFQFVQSKMLAPQSKGSSTDKMASMMTAQLTYFMPVVTILIAIRLPAALSLYWVITTLFAIGQQYYIMKKG